MVTEGSDELGFTVDTHLLRELGMLLVGRDSTALVELIKNAYDADAAHVTVHGAGLGGENGSITVSDDGTGMTFARFQEAFLRIAGRSKDRGNRSSPRYGRRYTGAKGIGRLAAHKLAADLDVESIPLLPKSERTGSTDSTDSCGISAQLHWDRMEEERNDLSSLGDTLTATRVPVFATSTTGTRLHLTHTRERWDATRLGNFLREVRFCRPPEQLVETPSQDVLHDKLLFDELHVADHGANDPGFTLDLTGDFDGGADLWQSLAERALWVIEIDSSPAGLRYGVAPTERTRTGSEAKRVGTDFLRPRIFRARHPNPDTGPFFQARVLVTEGSFGRAGTRNSELAQFARQEAGVRLFMEGFRVLPYGGINDDWLGLDRSVVTKQRTLEIDPRLGGDKLDEQEKESFFLLGNRSYFGAVVMTEAGSSGLDMVVNREGFVPNEAFDTLRALVRTGLDLSVRARAAVVREAERLQLEAETRAARERAAAAAAEVVDADADPVSVDSDATASVPGSDGLDNGFQIEPGNVPDDDDTVAEDNLTRLLAAANRAADQLGDDLPPVERRARTEQVRATFDVVTQRLAALRDEELTLRTLAGLGMQYTAFVHEVNGLLGTAQHLRALIDELVATPASRSLGPSLKDIRTLSDELVQALTRQASYLSDVVGPDARRRRRRMPVVERVESAMRLLGPQLNARQQELIVDVAPDVQTPPIFPAEFAIVLTNLLTNSIKFAGDKGRIRVDGSMDDLGRLHVRVENSGEAVSPEDRERYFRVFQSSTVDVDAVLGQGMGMGLPIVRSLLAGYDGTAEFVDASPGYATAVEVVLPDPRHRRRRTAAA